MSTLRATLRKGGKDAKGIRADTELLLRTGIVTQWLASIGVAVPDNHAKWYGVDESEELGDQTTREDSAEVEGNEGWLD